MKKFINIIVIIVIIMVFAACEDENNINNTNSPNNYVEEFCEYCIHYDIETLNPAINQVSNGNQRHLGTFIIFVDHAAKENFILKSLKIRLESTDQEEGKRENFYNSLNNFRVKINGIDFSNLLTEINSSEISLNAMSFNISPEQAALVEVWADIDYTQTEMNGRISVNNILIRNKDDQSHTSEQYLDAELGYNQCTLLLNWENLARTADPTCTMPGGLKISNDFEKEPEEPSHYINYDVEAQTLNRNIETLVAEEYWSESEQLWTDFIVHVNHNHSEDIYIKSISFKLRGLGTVQEETAFYQSLINPHLYFKVNGEYYFPSTDTLTEKGIHIMKPITETMPMTEQLYFTISVYVWDIDHDFDLLEGTIEVENIVFGDTPQAGIDEFSWEQNWNPNMGFSNGTSIIQMYQGAPANWQPSRLTIINNQ